MRQRHSLIAIIVIACSVYVTQISWAQQTSITATGRIVAKRQSNLSFDIPGTVVELPVQEGQHVDAGQLLAREDDAVQQLSFQQADLAAQGTQVALDKLLKPVDARDVANAEAAVKAAEGGYSGLAGAVNPNTIKAFDLQYQQAQAAAQNAEILRQGAGGQYAQDDPNYQKSVAQLGIAQTNAEIARLRLQQVQNGPSLLAATANIGYMQARLAQVKAGTNQLDVDDAQAQLATAKLQRDQAKILLDKTRLVAPFAGTVSKVIVKSGEVSGGPALVLIDDSQLYVEASVDETSIAHIQPGQPVTFTVDALPGTKLTGKVQRINQLADGATSVVTYTVRVQIDKTDAFIKVGMTANVSFGQ
jgi:multidrug resistance efflux pump